MSPRRRLFPREKTPEASPAYEGANELRPEREEGTGLRLTRRLRRAGNRAAGAALQRLRGEPLPGSVRADLQGAFHEDFGDVRIHDDAAAHREAAGQGAQAFTDGADIYLGSDAPALETPAGQRLAAHELAHITQARDAQPEDGTTGPAGGAPERAAHVAVEQAAGAQAAGGNSVQMPASGTPAGVQLQRVTQGASRADLVAALTQFLQQAQQAQGGRSVRVTPEVRSALELLANAPDPSYQGPGGDPGRALRLGNLQGWLSRPALPGDPADFARQVANLLPDPFDPSALERLKGARSAADAPSRFGRLKNLVESSAPGEPERSPLPPPEPTTGERIDQLMRDQGRAQGQPEPTEIGPYSVDVLRAGRIIQGLPGAWRGPQAARQPAPAALPEGVERAIQSVNGNALVPPGVRQDEAGNYADAQAVARHLAQMLDQAQAQGQESVDLRLGDSYSQVRERQGIFQELIRIVGLLRDSLPHHASRVRRVNVYFGDRVVLVIPVSAARE